MHPNEPLLVCTDTMLEEPRPTTSYFEYLLTAQLKDSIEKLTLGSAWGIARHKQVYEHALREQYKRQATELHATLTSEKPT